MKLYTGMLILSAVGCLGLAGCYKEQQVEGFIRQPHRTVAATEYRVYPPDVLHITSLTIPEINNTMQMVRPDGKVNLPLVGELEVTGRTPQEIEAIIRQAALKYFSEVSVAVEVRAYNSQRFYVFGQVDHPGPLPWTGRDTLLDALAKVQPNKLAWPERIWVVRGDDPKTGGFNGDLGATTQPNWFHINGIRPERQDRPRRRLLVNMTAMVEHGDMSNNILLMPDDVIYVQPHPIAWAGLALEQILFPVRGGSQIMTDYRQAVDVAKWIQAGQPMDTGSQTFLTP